MFPIVQAHSNNLSKPDVKYFLQGESKFDVCKNSFLQELKEGLNNVQAN